MTTAELCDARARLLGEEQLDELRYRGQRATRQNDGARIGGDFAEGLGGIEGDESTAALATLEATGGGAHKHAPIGIGGGERALLLDGLQFANGITLSKDQRYLLINETSVGEANS